MKAFQLALILLVACSSAVALQCNRCPVSGHCTVETCRRRTDVCGKVVSLLFRYSYKKCLSRMEASFLEPMFGFYIFKCDADLCN